MMRLGRTLWAPNLCVCLTLTGVVACGDAEGGAVVAPPGPHKQPIVAASLVALPHFEATGALLVATQEGTSLVHTQLCTATLIAPDYVVTAAHCRPQRAQLGLWHDGLPQVATEKALDVAEPRLRGARRPEHNVLVWYAFCLRDDVSPLLGVGQNKDALCTHGTRFEVHPQYLLPGPWDTGLRDAFDVGVVKLAQAVEHVVPATLAGPEDEASIVRGARVHIAGYGSTHDHAARGPKAHASGVKRYAETQIGAVSAGEMTIGEPPCRAHKSFGDSGGPTLVDTPRGPRLIGITSRLLGDTDAALGTVDTRLDTARDWLLEAVGLDDVLAEDAPTP